jgi:ATP-dependent Clp protease ATP-binding subunit ClpB
VLLQVLDDGRLTDGRGRLADFTNTVVIMTSNIGSGRLGGTPAEGETADRLSDALQAELREFFRPELINRIGDIVAFQSLSREHLGKIADIQLGKVRRLLEARGLSLEVSDEAKQRLVDLGYDPALGARPLERTIVRHVQDPVAEGLLSGEVVSGHTLWVGLKDDAIVVESRPALS